MSRLLSRKFVGLSGLAAAALAFAALEAAAPVPSPKPFSSMHMVLTKTFLGVRAAQVDVRFGGSTPQAIENIAAGQQYSDELAERVASAVLDARDFTVNMRFLRDVGFGEFINGTRDNVECAFKSRLIDEPEVQRVEQGTPQWFAPLAQPGFKEGDQITYVARGDTLWTTVSSRSGQVIVRRVERGRNPRHTLMASYFAPCSDFRDELVRSLFGTK